MGITFSFVIPSFNRPQALRRLLDSILNLDFPRDEYEIIVVDNATEFQAGLWIESWDLGHAGILCHHEPRPGSHHARNSGAGLAKGRYLVFLDDDCEATRNLLRAYAEVPGFSDIKMFGGKIEIQWDEIPSEEIRAFERLMGKIDYGERVFALPKGQYVNGGNMVIEREFYLQIGGMEPDQVEGWLSGSGDVGLCRHVQALGLDIFWVPGALVYHWQTATRNGQLRDLMRREMNNGICQAYEEMQQKKTGLRRRSMIKKLFARITGLSRKAMSYLIHALSNKTRIQLYRNLLDLAREWGYVYYYNKYLWGKIPRNVRENES
ncbi:MAG: glycosyltransferase [Chloroflexi bacterium]|nr:glycosyltransferase [Chloroflexota bacterium]